MFVEPQIAGSLSPEFDSVDPGWGLRIYIYNQFLDAIAAGSGTTGQGQRDGCLVEGGRTSP